MGGIASVLDGLADATELLELAESEQDEDTALAVVADLDKHQSHVEKLEFQRMFSGEMDNAAAFVDIQAGAGGTEAQDWAEILLRMYLRWCESRGWKTELMEVSGGDVAGIKSATLRVEGDYAYGWLKTETGVHRLVRKSPFDSDNRRHTSFTSVFVSPEIDDNIDITINPADLRTDVPFVRCRWPAREQDRVGGANHPHPDQYRRGLPDRPQPAPEPRQRDEDAGRQAV